jgi:chorismate-pyruvate lyase
MIDRTDSVKTVFKEGWPVRQTMGSGLGLDIFEIDGADPGNSAAQEIEALFSAQKERPAALQAVDPADLPPLLRILLVTDGTLTQLLEAYTLQRVEVILLSQQTRRLGEDDAWLEAAQGTEVIDRQIMLRGMENRTVYGFADSTLVTSRLSASLLDGLAHGAEGLGRLLSRSRTELRRERLWFGRQVLSHPPEATGYRAGQEFLSRSYRMVSDGLPLSLINEKFSMDLAE